MFKKQKRQKIKKPQSTLKKVIKTVISAIFLVALVVLGVVVNSTPVHGYIKMGTNMLMGGFHQHYDNSSVKQKGLDTQYYRSDYSKSKMKGAEEKVANQITDEGLFC